MKVAVLVYAIASRTYEVEVPDGTARGDAVLQAVKEVGTSKWRHVEEWDEGPDFEDALMRDEPVAVHALEPNGDLGGRIDEVDDEDSRLTEYRRMSDEGSDDSA